MTKEIPILDSCDVLVCGGGFGGISAALAAARLGKRVILLEKQYVLGGLGTAGLVTIYLPLCDGVGHQVSFGLAEELLRLSISMGAEDEYPANWLDSTDPAGRTEKDHRFRVRYNPWLFAILAEQELVKAGVKILYGCYAVDAEVREDRIHSVVVESISGRQKIRTRTVVDATGDAWDIALSYAWGVGGARAGVIKATFAQETEEDLFGEQAVLCGGLVELVKAGFETLTEAGYPEELAYFECYHEMKMIVDLMYESGIHFMNYSISNTAEYGEYYAGPKVINEQSREAMKLILKRIQNGEFAKEFVADCENDHKWLLEQREKINTHEIETTGAKIREMFSWVKSAE